jgi:glycosyltransferase involved in cell wall biosynthesis
MNKISCVIPTYNEESRIGNVLSIIASHPLVDEVIVVDDGSKDKTLDVVKRFPNVKLLVHETNKGKSAAIYDGCKAARGEFLLFLDADLVGLTQKSIADLIEPVLSGKADVTISYRGNSPRLWKIVGFDYISGERVFRKSLIESHLEKILALPKFGLEVFLNKIIIDSGAKVKIVAWPDVASPFKQSKYGLWKGIKGDIGMMRDIFTTFSFYEPAFQIIRLRKLRID